MNSILLSINPEDVAKILNGEKTIAILKTAPKCELLVTVYIYCTKEGRPLVYGSPVSGYVDEKYVQAFGWNHKEANRTFGSLNGKVVAKFTLSKIERVVSCIAKDWGDDPWEMRYALRLEESDTAHNDDQLIDEEGFKNEYLKLIYGYLGFDFSTGYSGFGERPDFKEGVVYGYAWHIDDLEIFDEPKKLLIRAPRPWCYVEEKKWAH